MSLADLDQTPVPVHAQKRAGFECYAIDCARANAQYLMRRMPHGVDWVKYCDEFDRHLSYLLP